MRERRAHWLRPNEAVRYPRRIVCLDSESRVRRDGPLELHGFRLAACSFDVIDRRTLEPRRSKRFASFDPAELWNTISGWTAKKERTVVWAHNLGFDLRVTQALELLPALGWEWSAGSLDSNRCWARWRREGATLLMVDSVSFVPRTLEGIAAELGLRKPPLPIAGAPDSEWLARCEADVTLLRAVVLRLLRWLEQGGHGNFKMTGPAQASASFRHRFYDRKALLVHDDREALEAERRGCWAGRCEVWRHGHVNGGLAEYDYSLAYARIARDARLPVRYRGSTGPLRPARLANLLEHFAVLAEVEIDTAEPVAPAEHEGRIVWPVGRFRTTLWGPELQLALEHGARLRVDRAWLYRQGPLLHDWACWILGQLEGPAREADPIGRAVLKAWSRALIGRFGLRYPRWAELGEAPEPGLLWLPGIDGDTGEPYTILQLGTQLLQQEGVEESPDSAPAVMGWIMAACRARLWRAMRELPAGSLAYVDTDSLLVTQAGVKAAERVAAEPEHEGLRVKARYRAVELLGPRQLIVDGHARAAGVPRAARPIGGRGFAAEVWEGPSESVRHGRPGEVAVRHRLMRLQAVDRRRLHLAEGATGPIRLGV